MSGENRAVGAGLRAWWRGEASAEETLLLGLIALEVAFGLVVLGIWLHPGPMNEVLEWRLYVEGWGIVPIAALGVAIGSFASVRQLRCVALLNALPVLGAALLLRGGAMDEAVLAWGPLALQLGVIIALRRLPFEGIGAWSVALTLLLLASALALLGVAATHSTSRLALVVLGAAVLAVLPALPTSRRWLARSIDIVVLVGFAWLLFDPHLHSDWMHHDWFLGPANAVAHGATMLGDVVCVYGVLPIYFVAGLIEFSGIPWSYSGFAALLSLLTIAQYALMYGLLRYLGVGVGTAFLALASFFLANFIGLRAALSAYPSLGPLRFLLPYALPVLVVLRTRFPGWSVATRHAEAAVVASSTLWSVETALFTLATYAGIVAVETVLGARRGTRWRADLAKRLGLCLLAIAVLQAGFWAFVELRTGAAPDWGAYFDLVRAYTPAGWGLHMRAVPQIGGWVAVLALYLASLLGCATALTRARSEREGAVLAVAMGITLMGVAKLSVYVGMSTPARLYSVVLPSLFVLGLGLDRLTRGDLARLPALRHVVRWTACCGLLLLALELETPLREWVAHDSEKSLGSDQFVMHVAGCASFPECVLAPTPSRKLSVAMEALLAKYAPAPAGFALVLGEREMTEVLFRSGRRNLVALNVPSQDALIVSNALRIVELPHLLKSGDIVLTSSAPRSNRILRGLEDRLRSRLCDEFECRELERRGVIRVLRLAARSEGESADARVD
jgi:hypothetical protein